MTDAPPPANFDQRPPEVVAQYEKTVSIVNVGHGLIFQLTHAILRASHQPTLRLLVVGAGGGQELRSFLPPNPGWTMLGVDPSARMLALAQEHAQALSVQERVRWLQGEVSNVPAGERFDAATCIFVLQFLPDDGSKLALLRDAARRLPSQAPFILVDGARDESGGEDLFPAWQEYGVLLGMPEERMRAILASIRQPSSAAVTGARNVALLHEAGFGQVTHFYSGLYIQGWLARKT